MRDLPFLTPNPPPPLPVLGVDHIKGEGGTVLNISLTLSSSGFSSGVLTGAWGTDSSLGFLGGRGSRGSPSQISFKSPISSEMLDYLLSTCSTLTDMCYLSTSPYPKCRQALKVKVLFDILRQNGYTREVTPSEWKGVLQVGKKQIEGFSKSNICWYWYHYACE